MQRYKRRSRRLYLQRAKQKLNRAKKNILNRRERGLRYIQRCIREEHPPIVFFDEMPEMSYHKYTESKGHPYTPVISAIVASAMDDDHLGSCTSQCVNISSHQSVEEMEETVVHELEHYRYNTTVPDDCSSPESIFHDMYCDEINAHVKEYFYSNGAYALEDMHKLSGDLYRDYDDTFRALHKKLRLGEGHSIMKHLPPERSNPR